MNLNVVVPSGVHSTEDDAGVMLIIRGGEAFVLKDAAIFAVLAANAGMLLNASMHTTATTVATIFDDGFIVTPYFFLVSVLGSLQYVKQVHSLGRA